jgi:hypothetical protein
MNVQYYKPLGVCWKVNDDESFACIRPQGHKGPCGHNKPANLRGTSLDILPLYREWRDSKTITGVALKLLDAVVTYHLSIGHMRDRDGESQYTTRSDAYEAAVEAMKETLPKDVVDEILRH